MLSCIDLIKPVLVDRSIFEGAQLCCVELYRPDMIMGFGSLYTISANLSFFFLSNVLADKLADAVSKRESPLAPIKSLVRNATALVPNAHSRITYVKLISLAD